MNGNLYTIVALSLWVLFCSKIPLLPHLYVISPSKYIKRANLMMIFLIFTLSLKLLKMA